MAGGVRQFRYALHVPESGAGQPEFAYWNGRGRLELGGVSYEGGQWASYERALPVSGLLAGEAVQNGSAVLTFDPEGVFAAWLKAGDQMGRPAVVRALALGNDGAWVVSGRPHYGELGRAQGSADDTLVVVVFSYVVRSTADWPAVLTVKSHQDRFPADTFPRFMPKLAKGVRL